MKSYQVVINGRPYRVEIENIHASPIAVTVDGETFAVTLEQESPAAGMPAPRIERSLRRPSLRQLRRARSPAQPEPTSSPRRCRASC